MESMNFLKNKAKTLSDIYQNSKYILKKLAKKYLPNHFVNRSKKGFGIPIAKWINGPLKEQIYDTLLQNSSITKDYFNYDYINRLVNEHNNKNADNRKLIWTLFVLENWLSNHPH